jgi:hypothetical protein
VTEPDYCGCCGGLAAEPPKGQHGKCCRELHWPYMPAPAPQPRGTCTGCGESKALRLDGTIRAHGPHHGSRCAGSQLPPRDDTMATEKDLGVALAEALLTLFRATPTRVALHTGTPAEIRPGQAWVRERLTGDDARLFDRVADLLGPVGAPALHALAARLWELAEGEGLEEGIDVGRHDG